MKKQLSIACVGLGTAIAMCLGAAGTARAASGSASASLAAYLGNGGRDWPGYGRSFREDHFSPLAQINQKNVGHLKLAWYMNLEGPGNTATQPVEVDGILYFATGLSVVHAVDARTGKQLWQYDPHAGEDAGKALRYWWGCRGVAWWNGKVYVGTVDGRLIALDAHTGKKVWSAQVTKKGSGLYLAGAPRAAGGKIFIGEANEDYFRFRGYADAYDAETGKRLWRFYTVPGNPAKGFENKAMAMAAKTWTGKWWKWGPGGAPWNAFAYDAKTHTVLFGTGNGFPWDPRIRSPHGGDNLFIDSLIAVDADTGRYKWHYQFNPDDAWDYDATNDIELADLVIDGKPRKVAMVAPKNGFFYVIDRTNGHLISAQKFAKVTWATKIDLKTGRPIEVPGARYPHGQKFELWPSIRGAHSVQPMAYSPRTKLAYIPKIEAGMTFSDRGINADHLGQWGVVLGPPKPSPLQNTSSLLAWNPITQKKVWAVKTYGGWNGGILATGGGLVFQGQITGRFSAYSDRTGKELWHFPTQAPILAAPISYALNGKQYISLLVGIGWSATAEVQSHKGIVIGPDQRRRVLTFVLDGDAKLPPAPPPPVIKAVHDPGYKPDHALAEKGSALFALHCAYCHGQMAIAGGYAPDLRVSGVVLSLSAFKSVVRGGTLVAQGMPKWGELSVEDVKALRQYIRSRAADLRAEKP